MLVVNSKLKIPLTEFQFTYVKSGGPGGQNVNKLNTKAVLRWDVAGSPSLPEAVRERFVKANRRRMTKEGEIVITSQRFRDQGRNTADCLSKLRDLLEAAATAPKKRKPTKPTRGARERRLKDKRQAGEKKQRRRPPKLDS